MVEEWVKFLEEMVVVPVEVGGMAAVNQRRCSGSDSLWRQS
jgi:hypothetical protein